MQTLVLRDGSVIGPPPLQLGSGLGPEVVDPVARALTQALFDGESLLGIVRLVSDGEWELLWVASEHHLSRVAFGPTREDARIVSVGYEHLSAGIVDLTLTSGERILLGEPEDPTDFEDHRGVQLTYFMRLPAGSDGHRVFVDPEPVGSYRWALSRN
ncbi:hypothetical protein [Pseudactinotalea terrae]|uniref:hypothetical protein n=1 Tax=Pseudactinotalea terrae TaxID=1743262 RepID=UPI0012E22B99|nr:hypothetical protein [Pseudactinotalea terrae]